MIKVLAIGNSFSQDAETFIHDIAKASGIDILFGGLYIGGCSLERHWNNIEADAADYVYTKTGCEKRMITIREALLDEEWDFVTMQQCSGYSGLYDSYQPYLTKLSAYVKAFRPDAEQLIHETWAYELDAITHPHFHFYDNDQQKMYNALKDAYDKAAASIGNVRIIPCGDAMQIARSSATFDYIHGGQSLNRDGYHASWTKGRYLLGCVWVEVLSGVSMIGNTFVPVKEDMPELTPTKEELHLLQLAAHTAVEMRKA